MAKIGSEEALKNHISSKIHKLKKSPVGEVCAFITEMEEAYQNDYPDFNIRGYVVDHFSNGPCFTIKVLCNVPEIENKQALLMWVVRNDVHRYKVIRNVANLTVTMFDFDSQSIGNKKEIVQYVEKHFDKLEKENFYGLHKDMVLYIQQQE